MQNTGLSEIVNTDIINIVSYQNIFSKKLLILYNLVN